MDSFRNVKVPQHNAKGLSDAGDRMPRRDAFGLLLSDECLQGGRAVPDAATNSYAWDRATRLRMRPKLALTYAEPGCGISWFDEDAILA